MKLIVARIHSPYPGVILRAGMEMTIEPDDVAIALIRRGYFREAPGEPQAVAPPVIEKKKKGKSPS